MELIVRTLGMLAANCYLLRTADEALVIDPGGKADILLPDIGSRTLTFVINTHGHYDHIAGNNELKARYDTKLVVGKYDFEMLFDPELNLSVMVDAPYISVAPDLLVDEGDILKIGGKNLEILHTPGHTTGSISIKTDKILFSGDTLFYHSIGRTDLPTGSYEELEKSIRTKFYILHDDTKVYTGHGEVTTIGEEKRHNTFFRT
jgi:glyoxylase-like metal-dependent hydrolase (beta-lactamase superfamily II)